MSNAFDKTTATCRDTSVEKGGHYCENSDYVTIFFLVGMLPE